MRLLLSFVLFLLPASISLSADTATAPSTADLIKALDGKDEAERIEAIDELAARGPESKAAVKGLATALADKSAAVRAHAALALGNLGDEAKPVVAALAKTVTDPEITVRRAAIRALRKIRPGGDVLMPLLGQALEEADPAVRMHALDSIAEVGEPAVPGLIKALGNEKGRYWALVVLSDMGPVAKTAVPDVAKLTTDKQFAIRREALMTLGKIGPDAASATPQIIKALGDEEPAVRYAAIFAIGQLGAGAKGAIPALKKNLDGKDEFAKVVSAWAIAKLQPGDKPALVASLPILANGLASEDANVRRVAVHSLVDLKPGAELALPFVGKIVDKADKSVIQELMGILGSMGEAAVTPLTEAVKRPNTRGPAIVALMQLGPKAAPATDALIAAASDEDPQIRREVAFALGAIGPAAKAAVPALTKLLSDEDPRVRHSSAYALGRIGKDAASAASELHKGLKTQDDPLEQAVSAWALVHINPTDKQIATVAVPMLSKMLDNERVMVRREAAETLGLIGPVAAAAVPALKKAAQDPNESVSRAATLALTKIEKK